MILTIVLLNISDWSKATCVRHLWSIFECLWQVKTDPALVHIFSWSFFARDLVLEFGVSSASAFDPLVIPPCHQQALVPVLRGITFAAKECASFMFLLVDHVIPS